MTTGPGYSCVGSSFTHKEPIVEFDNRNFFPNSKNGLNHMYLIDVSVPHLTIPVTPLGEPLTLTLTNEGYISIYMTYPVIWKFKIGDGEEQLIPEAFNNTKR